MSFTLIIRQGLDLILLCNQTEREVGSLAHLCDLLIHEELQVVILLILQVLRQLLNLLLQFFICFLHITNLLAEKFSFLREFLLSCQLP